MRKQMLTALLVLCLSTFSQMADGKETVQQLFQKHRYEEAIRQLYSESGASLSNLDDSAKLAFGSLCLENARLYQALYRISLAVHLDYLTRLIENGDRNESRLAKYYLGRTLLLAEEYTEASAFFRKFVSNSDPAQREVQLARIGLGIACYRQGNLQKARQYWDQVPENDPGATTALAEAYSRAGLKDKQPVKMCTRALELLSSTQQATDIQLTTNAVGVYAREGQVESCFTLIEGADLRAFFHEETPAKDVTIRFYDPSLLENLSIHYGKSAIFFLKGAAESPDHRIGAAAAFRLSEANELFEGLEQFDGSVQRLKEFPNLPARVKESLAIKEAILLFRVGDIEAAEGNIRKLAENGIDPDLSAELLLSCSRNGFDSPQAFVLASTQLQQGQGRRYSKLNYAMGVNYLRKRDYLKSISYMETGRDKSQKNSIESNDPLLLVDLAEAYYRSRKYSEALEIFFEMSKHYPAVRQIQVALQGIYLREQKSAGDAKIF